MLKSIRKSLKKDGRIALFEFREEDASVSDQARTQDEQEANPERIQGEWFKLESQYDGLPWQHLMFFVADEDAKGDRRSK